MVVVTILSVFQLLRLNRLLLVGAPEIDGRLVVLGMRDLFCLPC